MTYMESRADIKSGLADKVRVLLAKDFLSTMNGTDDIRTPGKENLAAFFDEVTKTALSCLSEAQQGDGVDWTLRCDNWDPTTKSYRNVPKKIPESCRQLFPMFNDAKTASGRIRTQSEMRTNRYCTLCEILRYVSDVRDSYMEGQCKQAEEEDEAVGMARLLRQLLEENMLLIQVSTSPFCLSGSQEDEHVDKRIRISSADATQIQSGKHREKFFIYSIVRSTMYFHPT